MPSDLERAAARFQADLLTDERAAVRTMLQSWRTIRRSLGQQITAVIDELAELDDDALTREAALRLFQLERLDRQARAEIAQFARLANAEITDLQSTAVQRAPEDAERLMRAAMGAAPAGAFVTFQRADPRAVAQLVGFLSDGSPLSSLLNELGPQAAQAMREALITGVGTGLGPGQTAALMRDALNGSWVRALRIARTEHMRAHRTARLASYRANADIVRGWIWHAKLDSGTCAVCWAMHGTFHALDESFTSHINCRCAPVPQTRSWSELGYPGIPDARPTIQPGVERFRALDADVQRDILGPGRFAAYQAGAFDLPDLVGIKRDPRWGRSRYVRSLKRLVGQRDAVRFVEQARAAD